MSVVYTIAKSNNGNSFHPLTKYRNKMHDMNTF